jgi:hypothetical protein
MKIFAALTAAFAILLAAGCGPQEPEGRIEGDKEATTETAAPAESDGNTEDSGIEEEKSPVESID